ncbi:PilX N-terminal domain-containing pilus assembly protein [Ferrimonas balearica]|uniref:pilus assembly PilX family protein n=1 Tax=Ferrimonas balearica TaxID=44012 RepID=UPI001C990303|nr:PilX N-terminal domain-containing pilus assembly protein [Ferrimonas balearica]MBY5922806.1 hypothetical protein [Ferrimonas balearica]MBY5997817.1 hypothetical protein [Ferrimonas balearica]
MGRESRGFATLGVTLLILVILAGVTLFAGKVLLMEKRISANEQQYALAFAYAESGLEAAARKYLTDPAGICGTSATMTPPGTSASVAVAWTCSAGGEPVTISATYTASDGGSGATVSEVYARSALFNSGEPAPLTLASASKFNGTLDIGAAPNGGGTGVPLSIWAGVTDDFTGAATTCPVEEFGRAGGACSTSDFVYSEKARGSAKGDYVQGGQDIVVDDAGFPEDMFEFAFGISASDWEQIYQRGATKIDDCTSLTNADTGIFVFEGTGMTQCRVNAIGSPDAPVILIAVNADMDLKTGPTYGVMFSFDSTPDDGVVDASLTLNATALVYGAVMSNGDEVPNMNGNAAVSWHPDVFSAIEEDVDGEFRPLVRVAGSWKDF